ncbi:CotH kinase family protein [Balneolales bacterium ANBcel1]|nr:CotH kinase family protein [Balneolales bacterium ANBcel1]
MAITANAAALFAFLFLAFTAGTGTAIGNEGGGEMTGVVINEVLSSNGSGIEDEDGDTVPWIELYNAGDQPVSLHYYGLSDDYSRPWRWVMPDVTLQPGEFLLIFASGKNRSDPAAPLHTNFRVSQSGEEVVLTDVNGRRIDHIPPTFIPTDVSYGRYPDGSDHLEFFDRPTPGEPNVSSGFDELLEPPSFSHTGGFYTEDFDLELSTPSTGAVIRYTLDGSEPDSTSPVLDGPIRITDRTPLPNNLSMIVTAPLDGVHILGFYPEWPDGQVFKGNVVRARVFRPGSRPSRTATHSFFVDRRGGDRYHMPVVSIVTDSLHLFGYETGIYVPGIVHDYRDRLDELPFEVYEKLYDADEHLVGNYSQRGHDWERPASFEFFDEQGGRVHSQDIGIRIHGGGSRALTQKSLRLYARNEYGENRFRFQVFPDLPHREYNRLILRNSGQDFFVRSTMFRDAFMQKLIGGLNFDTQAYRPSVVFINGEYWGIHNIRERYDEDYLARTYGVDPGRVQMLNDSAEVDIGSNEHYLAMMDFVAERDPADPANYEHIRTMMDVDNYLDYLVAQAFIRNVDWPGNNIEYWRLDTEYDPDTPPGHDGRWRWLMIDTDAGFGLLNPWRVESFDMINHMTSDRYDDWPNPEWSTRLIRRMMRYEEFRNEFINRSADYMNTLFHPDHVIPLIDRFEENLEPVIEEHIRRWGQIASKERWHFNVERMREFARKRPGYNREHIRRHFGLRGMADLTVDVSGLHKGRVQVNRLVIDGETEGPAARRESPYPWKGRYFADVPVRVTVLPYDGYRFSHWEGTGIKNASIVSGYSGSSAIDSDTLTLIFAPDRHVELKAVFVPDETSLPGLPAAHPLVEGDYRMDRWDPDADPGSWPDNMVFQYMADPEPGLDSPAAGVAGGAYNLSSRTRINGMGEKGFSFINTSSLEGNPGFPGLRLGAAVLALDTREMKEVSVSWTGGTVEPNSRVYHLRLQHRIGSDGEFRDVVDESGEPVEYERHHEAGHSRRFRDIRLPDATANKPRVELRWKYYYTGIRKDDESGARSRLRVGEIHVTGRYAREYDGQPVEKNRVLANYPNPFNQNTFIQFQLEEETTVAVSLFDVSGRKVMRVRERMRLSAGHHAIRVDASGLSSGMYLYRVETPDWIGHGKMTLIR